MGIGGLDEDEQGFKIRGRNINDLCSAGDATLVKSSGKESASSHNESEGAWWTKMGLRLKIQKTKLITVGSCNQPDSEDIVSFCLWSSAINSKGTNIQ